MIRQHLRVVAITLVLTGVVAACSREAAAPSGDRSRQPDTRPAASSAPVARQPSPVAGPSPEAGDAAASKEPLGTQPQAVAPSLDTLLQRYDEVSAGIVGDPKIAANRQHRLYDELRALMDPDSEMMDAVIQTLVAQGERGTKIRPYEDAERPTSRSVDGDVRTISSTRVRFPVCTVYTYIIREASRIEVADGHERRTEGTAVRIDGRWRVSRLESDDDMIPCEKEHPRNEQHAPVRAMTEDITRDDHVILAHRVRTDPPGPFTRGGLQGLNRRGGVGLRFGAGRRRLVAGGQDVLAVATIAFAAPWRRSGRSRSAASPDGCGRRSVVGRSGI